MKQLLIVSLLSIFSAEPALLPKAEKSKIYFYCQSGTFGKSDFSKTQVIQFTEIKEFIDDDREITKLTAEWANLVNRNCENAPSCSSNLNTYTTYEAAKEQYDNMLKRYADTSLYVLKKRSF
jgi:hypothetical protein